MHVNIPFKHNHKTLNNHMNKLIKILNTVGKIGAIKIKTAIIAKIENNYLKISLSS